VSAEPRTPSTAPRRPSLPRVARSEAELLTLTRAILNPTSSYIPSLRQRPKRAIRIESIGPAAMGLLQQTLARGVCAALLRRGGWETRRTLVAGQPKRGRLWQRHPVLPVLRFGPASFRLLCWLRAEDVAQAKAPLEHDPDMSIADELLHYLAAERVVRAGGNLHQPAFLCSPLCQLGWAHALAEGSPLPKLDFRRLAAGEGAIVLEALQSDLARRQIEVERHKGEIVPLDTMIRIGSAQELVLDGLFRALDLVEPRRRELASFVAEAARELLARGPERRCPDQRWWIRSLDLRAPLSARQAAFSAAAAFLRAIGRLGRWLDEAGIVAHFDEDYEAAQLLLSSWHDLRTAPPAGPPLARATPEQAQPPATVLERAAFLATALESLHSLGSTTAPASSRESP
jgi:hypothetical protein